ncbi:MAG: hypothetical protein ACYDA8_23290 [Deferrisomatales bacterium]
MPIHLGKRPSREGWLSFETDDHLRGTKDRLWNRCLPCLTGLYEALRAGAGELALLEAWDCWKVTAVVDSLDEGLEVLSRFGEAHPGEPVYGKVGGGVGRPTCAVVFHTEGEARRDELLALLGSALARFFPGRTAFASRACGNPYEALLGPWPTWTRPCPLRHPERVPAVLTALRDSLYRR